jgi:hypothetical protein
VAEEYIPAKLMPLFIIKIGHAQEHHGTVPNPELNALTYLTEYMAESQ